MLAYKLRYGDYLMDGHLDLGPKFALKSVSPLLKPGVEKYRTLADVTGYETVYYDVQQRGDGSLKIALRSVEQLVGRTTAKKSRPTGSAAAHCGFGALRPPVLPRVAYFRRLSDRAAGDARSGRAGRHDGGVREGPRAFLPRNQSGARDLPLRSDGDDADGAR